jgi:prevent-host-death family protein
MEHVAIFEAKTRLSELLAQVQQGHEITITRHGVPMAKLVPVDEKKSRMPSQRQQVDAAFKALQALSRGVTLDVPLREAIVQGRD